MVGDQTPVGERRGVSHRGGARKQKVFEDSFCREASNTSRSCRREEALTSRYAMSPHHAQPSAQGLLHGREAWQNQLPPKIHLPMNLSGGVE
jgi:hypothetical protein